MDNQIYYNRTLKFGIFILDFYAKKIKLAIEIDGEYHSTKEMQAKS